MRKRKTNKHHLLPKARGGSCRPENLANWDKTKHEYWHKLFGLMTIVEVISFLIRYLHYQRRKEKMCEEQRRREKAKLKSRRYKKRGKKRR